MLTVVDEIIYTHRVEEILEDYLTNHTNSYPNGCYVSMGMYSGQIVANVYPKETNISYTITYSN